jgi:molybdopterin-guanine dinucleotide biosynthesis protein A
MNMNNEHLYGLVLAGGKSSRMGREKAAIKYHGKPQIEVAVETLSLFCSKVFVSTRKDQAHSELFRKFHQIHDEPAYEGKGPLAGIISAMHAHPTAAWVVLACDLPFVNETDIQYLLEHRDTTKVATAFKSPVDGLPEPLCAVWEPEYLIDIEGFMNKGGNCARKFLIQCEAPLIVPPHPKAMENINNPDEFKVAMKEISPDPADS